MRVKLVVAYDGTAYCGWQVQPNGITVQQVLNETLSELFQQPISVVGASRTDAGVHALGNVCAFDVDTRMPGEKIAYALNQRLPEDIVIQESAEVDADFHPRFSKSDKTYEYRILNRRFADPTLRHNTYFFHHKLDVDRMQQAANVLIGEHDFTSFASVHSQTNTFVRTIYDLTVTRDAQDIITIRVRGNGFLYNMVRIIAGTLFDVGRGKIPAENVALALSSGDRELLGVTAPAKGLTLESVEYESLTL